MTSEESKFLAQADDFLQDAMALFAASRWKGTANRAYFAMVASVQALLFREGIFVKTHKGLHSEFSQRFIRTGRLASSLSKSFKNAEEIRQTSDYDADSTVLETDAAQLIAEATEFVSAVRAWLQR